MVEAAMDEYSTSPPKFFDDGGAVMGPLIPRDFKMPTIC